MVQHAQTTQKAIWRVDPAHTTIEFSSKHMMIFNVKGRFAKFDFNVDFDEIRPENSKAEVVIYADSLDTKETKRDDHLRSQDFLWVEKYPTIAFKSKRIERLNDTKFNVIGDLTIRDVTREVTLDATLSSQMRDPWGNLHRAFSAETTVNRKVWGLTWNMVVEAGGLLVGDHAKLTIEAELVKPAQ